MQEISIRVFSQGKNIHLIGVLTGIEGQIMEDRIAGEQFEQQKENDNGSSKLNNVHTNSYSS